MSGIFLSYRREDSAGHAGRLFDHLARAFGDDTVFMDVDKIERGATFSETLNQRLREADVLLAVIGRQWLTLTDSTGRRRLDSPDDWVRNEISAALSAGHLVIPVLVGSATLPNGADLPENIRALAARQVAEIRDGSWNDDVARLCRDIKRRRARGSWLHNLRDRWMTAAMMLALLLVAGGYSTYTYIRGSQTLVPHVSGLTLERATRTIQDAGLQIGTVSKLATNEHPPDWVIEQTPATQTSVRKGTAVALVVASPKAVDLSQYAAVRDVGSEGTVAAAAAAIAMDASLAAQRRPMSLSMRYIYEKAKRHDEVTGEGTFLETTIYVTRQFGAPPESLWPYESQNRRLPQGVTWAALDRAAADYKAVVTQVADVDGILGALDKGMPVIVAANVTDLWDPEPSGKSGIIRPSNNKEGFRGATVITIVGYDPATDRFKFANNWGTGWGDRGFGYFVKADAKEILLLQTGIWSVSVPVGDRE